MRVGRGLAEIVRVVEGRLVKVIEDQGEGRRVQNVAGRIIEARKTTPFKSVDDLRRVSGIGPKTLDKLRPRVTVRQVTEAAAKKE